MKKLFIFLLVTLAVLGVSDMFFEYCVSRDMPIFITTLATIGMLMMVVWYIIYAVKLLKTILKL
jgi:hypothetical protein